LLVGSVNARKSAEIKIQRKNEVLVSSLAQIVHQ
jgi:hypothetical protein